MTVSIRNVSLVVGGVHLSSLVWIPKWVHRDSTPSRLLLQMVDCGGPAMRSHRDSVLCMGYVIVL